MSALRISAVTVTPAPGDVSEALKLGLAWGGTEVSGSAVKRPAATVDAQGLVDPKGLTGGADGGQVQPSPASIFCACLA